MREADPGFGEDDFRLFYGQTSRKLWAYLVRLVSDASLADDLLQEAYLRFLRAGTAGSMTDQHRRNSLYRIATNLVRDHKRRRQGEELTEHPSPGDLGADVSGRRDVRRALDQMNPREREILWLAYVERFSHEEIAKVVGARAQSIRPMLWRARQKLAESLKAYAL